MQKGEACLGASISLTQQVDEGDPNQSNDDILYNNASLNKNNKDNDRNSIFAGNSELKCQQIVDIQNNNLGEHEISNENTQNSSIKTVFDTSQIDQHAASVTEDSSAVENSDNSSQEALTLKMEKANILAATRAVKKSAMSRMRNSVKLTLFKGISKKVNPESAQDVENHQSETNKSNQQLERKEEICETEENQTEMDFQIHSEMRTSVDMSDSKDKQSESTSLHKHRYNSLWNVIINERDPKTIGQSSPESNSSPKRAQIINQTRIFEENYELMGQKLGEGCHGEVRKCIHKTTKKIYAVKMIRNGDTEIILSAITSFKIAKNLNHPAVIKPKELFINRETEKIYYVMEYCEYGSLQEYIENALNMSPRKRDKNRPRPPSIEYYDEETEETQNNKKSEKCINCQSTNSECNTAKHNKSPRKRNLKKVDKPFQLNEVVSQYVGETEENKEKEYFKLEEESVQLETQIGKEQEEEEKNINEQQPTQVVSTCDTPETLKDKSPQEFTQSNENLCGVIDCEIAKKILKEILLAVSYLHSEGICHRDLKPDNILLNKDRSKIKIIDFEISKQFKYFRPNHQVLKVCEMWTRTGTQDYMAPEMFESTGYSESVDIWAIGVIAYFLLTGRLPFDQEYISDKVEAIRNCSYNTDYLRNLDEVPKDFIRRMLRKDPGDRLSAVEALSHPWFLVNTKDKNQFATRFSKRKKSTKNNSSHSPSPKNSPEHRQQLGFLGNNSTILFTPTELPQQTEIFNNSQCKINNNHSKFCEDNQNIHKNITPNANDNSDYENSPYSFSTKVNKENKYISSMNLNNQEDGKMTDNPKKNICFFHEKDTNSKNCSEFDNNLDENDTNIPLFCPIVDSSEEIDLELNHPMLLQESSSVDRRNKQLFAGDQPLTFQYQQSQQQVCSNNSINSQLSNSNSSQQPSGGKNVKIAKKKEEFKKNLLDFKQQMADGMTDILSAKFIHINQKQRQHPQASQLRLKLLQQKRDSNINSNPQPAQSQTQTQLLSQSKDLLQIPTSVSTMNITQGGSDNPNTFYNILQQSQGNNCLPLIPISPLAAQISSTCNSIGSNSSFQATANNNNNTYASNVLISDSQNQLGQHSSQLEVQNDEQQQQQQQGQQLQNSQLQQLQIALSSQSSIYRSRSNTNDINNHSFESDEINDERRAKRLSEDFTSSCEVQTPIKKAQSTTPTSSQLSQTIGRVTKSSQFSNLRFAPKTKNSSIQSSAEEIQLDSSSSASPQATVGGGGGVAQYQKQFQKIQQQCSLEVQLSGKHSSELNQKKLTIFNFCEGNMKQQQQQQGRVEEETKEEIWGNQEICQVQCDGSDAAAEDESVNVKIQKQQHLYGFPSQFRDFSDEKEKD